MRAGTGPTVGPRPGPRQADTSDHTTTEQTVAGRRADRLRSAWSRASSRSGLPPLWIEAAAVVGAYLAYQLVQMAVAGTRRSAVFRAEWLWHAEQRLHLDPELALNHLVTAHHWLAVLSGLYYGSLHFLVTPLVLVWLRLRRPVLYAPLRNVLVLVSLVALLAYWLLPLAPPRLAIPGIVDTLKVNDILSAGNPKGPASLANQYAAMPSLHIAWAVWVALAVVAAWPVARASRLVWLYPLVSTLVVLGTGNHFLMDAVAGAALVAAAAWVVSRAQPFLPGTERTISLPASSAAEPASGTLPPHDAHVAGGGRAQAGPTAPENPSRPG